MAFSSQLLPGEIILDDNTPDETFEAPQGFGRGLDLSRRTDAGYAGVADMFPDSLLIPESEWEARIKEKEERKTRLSDIVLQAGLPCKDQASTNFCWANAPVHCMEIIRVIANEPMVILSPASVACPINGFRNEGGWGKDALEYIIENGVVPVDMWPANSINRSHFTDAAKEKARDFRAVEWWELRPRNLKQHVSLLLRNIPLAVGLNYWRHEVTDYEPVWIDGTVAIRFRNSWTEDWPTVGARGFSIRRGSKMYADDAVAPRTSIVG